MTYNASSAKGKAAERDLVRYFKETGFPDARRTKAGQHNDPGDIYPIPGFPPPVIVSVKSGYGKDIHPQTDMWHNWWLDLQVTVLDNSPAALSFLVHKRDGKADPAFWHWYTDLGQPYDIGPVKVTGPQAIHLIRRYIND